MKLHLPTRLRAAVLACITAVAALSGTVGTGTITTGVVAYTIAASQAEAAALVNRTFDYEGVTYSGGALVTLDVANSANVTAGGASHTLTGVDQMTVSIGSETMLMTDTTNLLNSTGKGDSGTAYVLWQDFASSKCYYGQTIRLTGATEAWTTVFNYSPITYGGVITDAASDDGAYTIGRTSATVEFIANEAAGANMLIDATTTVAANVVSVKTSGTWALNKNLTLGAATTVDANKTITLTGSGALNISGALTLNAGSGIAAENNAIAINGALSMNLDGVTAGADAIISSAGAVSATGLTLSNYLTLAAGSYKLISTTSEAASSLAALFTSTEQFSVTNKNGVVTLTVKDMGMETLDADIVAGNGTTAGNIHNYYASGLDVGEHTITATYTAVGYSTLYTKGLQGSGNITFDRTFTGGNLCVLWIDGEASEYTGTIAVSGPNANAFLKLGSDAAASTDLSSATVNMTKQVIAVGGDTTIGTLTTNGTEIRAVDGLTSRISEMTAGTGMTTTTTGFAQKDDASRTLTLTTGGTLTSSTINKGVNLTVAQGATVTLAGGTVNGTLTNNGSLGLSGAITLSNSIATGLGSMATFANDVVIDISQLTATEGVYHLLTGMGTSNLGSLTSANITGIDTTGKTLAFDNSGTITLIDNTSDLIWKGGSGTWDETSQNWTKNGNPSVFADADRVTFNETSDVTLVGDLRAGGMAVNADVTLSGSGNLAADSITIDSTAKLTVNGDATVAVDRANLNRTTVSGNGTLVLNQIGTSALAFDGGEAGFSGTLVLNQEHITSHGFTTTLTNFTGTVEINALINHGLSNFGDASKLVFVGSRATDLIGFWCAPANAPTLTQEIEIAGENEVRFFMNGTTLNGAITGNKLMLRDGTANLGGTVNLARLNFATDNLVVNMLADSTLGELVHDGNRTTLNVGNAEHQVTLNITGSADRIMNAKSHVYAVAAGSVINDNTYLRLTNSTLTLNGGGVYNVRGVELSAEGNGVGNMEIAAGTTLHVTGTTVSSSGHTGSFMVSHWNATNTIRLDGTLISDAGISSRDGTANININNGGVLQLNAGFVSNTDRTNNATLNVEDGGTLKVASTTTAYNNQITVNLKNGSTFEGFAADGNATIAQNMTIVGTAEAPATAKIKVDADKSLTLSGVISGENGALNKTGDGTLVLSGTNTYAGGTTITAGTLDAVGSLSTGDITVGAGSTIILHNKLDATKLTNNGAIEIASGFSGLESAGVTKIDGGAEGNGFNQGGTANLFNGTGVVEGTLSATFNGATVAVAADGSMTLADDWGTYHINNALLETETFNAIKTAATAHSATLSGIDFALADQTLTVDADGFATSMVKGEHAATAALSVAAGLTVTVDSTTMPATTVAAEGTVTLHMADNAALNLTGASTLNVTGADASNTLDLGNGTMSRTLSIVGATVTSSHSGGTGFNTGTTFIGAGGTLSLTAGNDALGWDNGAAGTITLLGEAENLATLELGGRATMSTSFVMQGNSIIKATASPAGTAQNVPALDPKGGSITVSGTNNVIATNIRQRDALTISVADASDLTVTGSITRTGNGGRFTKEGAGTVTFASTTADTLSGYKHKAGSTVFSGMTGLVFDQEIDASDNGTSAGSISFVNGAEAKINSTLWLGGNASILVDETSTLTKHTEACDLSISGVTGQTATIAGSAENDYFDFDNGSATISNAAATVTAANAVEMALNFASTSSVTNAGAGTLTLTGTGVTSLAGVNAQGGDITLNAATSIGALTIADGKTVTAAATDPLGITSALTAGAGSTLSTALSIANSASLDLVTGDSALSLGNHAITLGTGLTVTEAMMNAITALQADQSLTLFKGVSSLTGGDMDATEVISGLTGDFTIKVQDGNLVVSAAALPTANLTWLGGDGTWGGESEPWTKEGDPSAYVEGATVTIGGEGGAEGGVITVSGEQTAKNVTIVESGYSIQRADSGTNSLTIQGALTVADGVSFSSTFLPTVGSIVLNEGSELFFNNADYVNINGNLKNILGKISAESTGTLKMTGGTGIADGNRLMLGGQNVTISGAGLHITNNMAVNTYQGAASLVVNSALTVDGELRMESLSKLDIQSGAEVTLGTLTLGHAQAGNPGHLAMAADSALEVGSIQLLDDTTQNTITVNGGLLTIKGKENSESHEMEAFVGTGTATTVNISSAELTNGTTDLTFNHASTLTGATITAQDGTTITMGGEDLTTNVATGITTNGNVEIAGTTAISGDTTVTSEGALTIDSISATAGATLTTAGEGSTTISGGSVDKIVANGTTTLGDVTVKNIHGTITQAEGTTLTLADGATLDGAATIGAATAAGSLTKTGTDTVTTGDITGTSTALAVNGGTLSTGAVSGLSTVTVAQGATLTSTGDVTATGNATINGSLTAGSLTAANITVAQGATVGATTGMSTAGTLTLNDSATLGSLAAGTVSLAADKTLTVTGAADITSLTLSSVAATPAVNLGSLTSSAMEVNVAIATLHSYFEGATGNSVTIATLGATSATNLSLTNTQGGGYDYSITLDNSNNIVISRDYSGIVWQGGEGAQWGQGGSWQGGDVPETSDAVSFIGNQGTTVTSDVTIAAGGVSAGSVSVTGSESVSADYTFAGGSLTAADLLIENGSLGIANESTFTSGSVEATGTLTVDGADAALELGTLTVKGELTVESGELTITDTLTTEAGATLAFNGGSSAITTATLGSDTIVIQAPASVLLGTVEGEETTVQLAGALNVVKGDIKKIEGIVDGADTIYGDLTVGTVQTGFALTPNVTTDVAIAEASDVNNLTVTGTGNLAAQDTLHVHGTAEVAENGVMTVAKDTTIDDTLTNKGDITIGSAAAPATLATAKVTNDGTITVYNTMTATDDVTNNAGATLDVKGALTANEAGKTVENGGTLTVGGALTADTLTTNAGGSTEAKAGATISTALTNHGKTTVTGNLVSADTATSTPGSATITNDATGTDEKLVVTGNVSGASLTTETGATTEIGGTTTLSGSLTNKGTTKVTGAANVGDDIINDGVLNTGALTVTDDITNTGTMNTGNLSADAVDNGGTINVTGTATVKDLSSTVATSLLDVTGALTIAQGGSLNSTGDITAGSLNLSNLAETDKATVGDLKTDAITLNGLSSATTGLTVETLASRTADKMVTIYVADSIVNQLAALEESDTANLITVTSTASTGKMKLDSTAENKIAAELDKKLLTYSINNGVLTVLDNSLDKGFDLSENAKVGMDMVTEAYRAVGGTPTDELKAITDALKDYRATNKEAAAEQLATALSGSSIAAMGSALSADVDRQLKAIRNRTTSMGVNQSVINEGMPYVNAWVNAEGDYRKVAADGSMAGYKMMSWGGTVGMDVDFTPSFTCGIAGTAMYGNFDADGEDHATGDLNTYYVSAFARYAKHRWTHTFVATAGMADTSLDRTIMGNTVKGDSDGMVFGGMYEVGYVFALDKEATTCLQPIVNVSYTHATLNGYDEEGGNIGLSAGDTELSKLSVGVGARLQSVVGENIYNRSSLLEARALVKFDAGDRQAETDVAFAGYKTPTHTTKATETGAVGAEFGVGLTVPVGDEGGNIFMDASAEIRAEYTNVNATVGYRVNF